MPTERQVIATIRKALSRAQFIEEKAALTGYDNGDGSYTVVVEDEPNKIWVRLVGEQTPVPAWNNGVGLKPNVAVIVGPNQNGELEIKRTDLKKSEEFLGSAATSFAVAPHSHDPEFGTPWTVPGRSLRDGRVRNSELGGLFVYVEPFYYEYKGSRKLFEGGTLDLTAKRPATANHHAWVLVWVNPVTNTLDATTGTSQSITLPLTHMDLFAIPTALKVPADGVILKNGQTSTPLEADYASARGWRVYQILHNYSATADPGTGDDSADGYEVGSRWFNLTTDKEFVCLDATAAAAVWKETTAGGGGGFSMTTTELDFGSTPVRAKVFTVTDAGVSTSNKIIMLQSSQAATGRSQDENEMDALVFRCVGGSGQFTVYADSLFGPVIGKYKAHYAVA